MDKRKVYSYTSSMRIPSIYSAAAATFFIVFSVDVAIQHLAFAQENPQVLTHKLEALRKPVVFARFAKGDSSVGLQALEDTLACQQGDAFFPSYDICAPSPGLTAAKSAAQLLPAKWHLQKMPVSFVWQQPQIQGHRLVVELLSLGGRPINATSKYYKKRDKESVEVTPSATATSETEFHLVGNIYAADGSRVENWVLPIALK